MSPFWKGAKESYSRAERVAQVIIVWVTLLGPLVAFFWPDWWKLPLSWPRITYLFVPFLLLVAYFIGKGYTTWRQPKLRVGSLRADNRPGFPVFYLTVTNASDRAVTPFVEVLPVYDIKGERLSNRFEAHWRGAKEENPRPLVAKKAENEAGILLVDLEQPNAPRLARFPINEPVATRFSDEFVPLQQQPVVCLRLVIYCKDEEGHSSDPISQSYHLVPDRNEPLCYKVLQHGDFQMEKRFRESATQD